NRWVVADVIRGAAVSAEHRSHHSVDNLALDALMSGNRELFHAVLFTPLAGCQELEIASRSRIGPAPVSGDRVRPAGKCGSQANRVALQVGDAAIDAGLPTGVRVGDSNSPRRADGTCYGVGRDACAATACSLSRRETEGDRIQGVVDALELFGVEVV